MRNEIYKIWTFHNIQDSVKFTKHLTTIISTISSAIPTCCCQQWKCSDESSLYIFTIFLWQIYVTTNNKTWPLYKVPYILSSFNQFGYHWQIFVKVSNANFRKIRPIGAKLIWVDGQTRQSWKVLFASIQTYLKMMHCKGKLI